MGSVSPSSPRPLQVLVDTNVVLDQLLGRDPWYTQAQPFWQARDAGKLIAYLSATTITDIYYIARRQVGSDAARLDVERCLREFGLLAVARDILERVLAAAGSDFEDNIQITCAQAAGLDLIITRNVADFRYSPIPAIEPAAIVNYLTP